MKVEKTQPELNVYFINTINTSAPNYGASINNEYISLIDNSNNSAFGYVGGGALKLSQITPIKGIGNYWTTATAGTAGVVTVIEPTLAANTTYQFILNQYIPANTIAGTPALTVSSGGSLSFTTGATAPAAGTIVTAFAAIINANSSFQVTAVVSATTHLTITGSTGYYIVYPNAVGASVGNLNVAQTTQGIQSQGYVYDMADNNGFGSSWASYPGYVSTNVYAAFECAYTDTIYGNTTYIYVFVNSGDANFGTTSTGFVYSFVNNVLAMGGVINSQNSLSVLSLLQQANALEYTSL